MPRAAKAASVHCSSRTRWLTRANVGNAGPRAMLSPLRKRPRDQPLADRSRPAGEIQRYERCGQQLSQPVEHRREARFALGNLALLLHVPALEPVDPVDLRLHLRVHAGLRSRFVAAQNAPTPTTPADSPRSLLVAHGALPIADHGVRSLVETPASHSRTLPTHRACVEPNFGAVPSVGPRANPSIGTLG